MEAGSLEVGFMKIEASTVFLGYASLCASEHIQDRLDVSSRTAWLWRSNLLRHFIRFGGGFVRCRKQIEHRRVARGLEKLSLRPQNEAAIAPKLLQARYKQLLDGGSLLATNLDHQKLGRAALLQLCVAHFVSRFGGSVFQKDDSWGMVKLGNPTLLWAGSSRMALFLSHSTSRRSSRIRRSGLYH